MAILSQLKKVSTIIESITRDLHAAEFLPEFQGRLIVWLELKDLVQLLDGLRFSSKIQQDRCEAEFGFDVCRVEAERLLIFSRGLGELVLLSQIAGQTIMWLLIRGGQADRFPQNRDGFGAPFELP